MSNLVLEAKKNAQAQQVFEFFKEIYQLCNVKYADLALDALIKKHKIPTTFYSTSKEYALFQYKREGMYHLYLWNSIEPTFELAFEFNNIMRAINLTKIRKIKLLKLE